MNFENLEYKHNGNPLSYEELKRFSSFYLNLISIPSIKIIFRGENYLNLKEKLSIEEDNSLDEINRLIFSIGEKGRVYQKAYAKKIVKKGKIYTIDNTDIEIFSYLFKKLNYILTKKSENPVVRKFILNNKDFNNYFSNKENKNHFISIISDIDDKIIKIKIRDYYLKLLHQFGQIGFYYNSFFLSTSEGFSVAKMFTFSTRKIGGSTTKKSKNKGKNQIIFIGWTPTTKQEIKNNKFFDKKTNPILLEKGLPIYLITPFPNQKEISIKGGLLPHYILGYIKDRELIINPHFFTTTKTFSKIIEEGFDIDQSDFEKKIKNTNYYKYFSIDEDNNYFDNLIS